MGDLRDPLFGEIAINPADPKLLLVGLGSGGCARSRDGGVTWQACVGPSGRVIGFHFDRTQRGQTLFAATDQGLWRSDDDGQTWVEHTQGLPWKALQAFAGGSDPVVGEVILYCAIQSKEIE